MNKVAKYNAVVSKWNDKKSTFDNGTTIFHKMFRLWCLYSDFCDRRKLSMGFDEGLHRKVGVVQATMGSLIDATTGCITGYGQYKLTLFANVGFVPDLVLKENTDINYGNREDTKPIMDAHIHATCHKIMNGETAVANKTMINIYGNPIGVNLTDKVHEQEIGGD